MSAINACTKKRYYYFGFVQICKSQIQIIIYNFIYLTCSQRSFDLTLINLIYLFLFINILNQFFI